MSLVAGMLPMTPMRRAARSFGEREYRGHSGWSLRAFERLLVLGFLVADLSASPLVNKRSEAIDPYLPLVQAAVAGEAAAVRAVLAGIAPLVLSVVRRLIGASHADVDDLTQEALVGIVRALPTFRGECTVAHFAARITVRRTIDARRRAREQSARIERMGRLDDPPESASPATATTAERRRRIVRALLDTLPDAQAETMALRFALGYSLDEVAAATGAPMGTVRSRLRLARDALRKRIEEDPTLAELLEMES